MKSRSKAVYGVLFMVFLLFLVLLLFTSQALKNLNGDTSSSSSGMWDKESKGGISVIEVEGIIMDSKKTVELLQQVEKDEDTRAVILRINSPGGAVGPTQEIYEEIIRIDHLYEETKGKKGKPIYASFGAIAASGGYYLGAAAREIYSNPGTLTGSIGVIMQFYDLSKLYEWAKVGQANIKAGKYKDIGTPTRAMRGEEKDLLDQMVLKVHQQFKNDIKKTRGKKLKKSLDDIAQGQIFSGEEALELGLVDKLGSLWMAGREIHKKMKLEGDFGLKYIKKKKKKDIWQLVDQIEEVISDINPVSLANKFPMLLFLL